MLRYIFISVLFFLSLSVRSQVVQEVVEVPRGFTLGVNLAGPINKLFDTDRTGISFLTRINLKEDLFFIGEAALKMSILKRRLIITIPMVLLYV